MEEPAKVPGITGYIVALVILLIGITIGVVLMVMGVGSASEAAESGFGFGGPQYEMPGSHDLDLKKPGRYVIFHETRDGTDPGPLPDDLTVTLTDKDTGDEISLTTGGEETYNLGQRRGQSVYTFGVDQAGTYVLEGEYPPQADPQPEIVLVVGTGMAGMAKGVGGIFARFMGACCTVPVAIVVAVIVAIVTAVRRGNAKKRLRAAEAADTPGPGGADQYHQSPPPPG